MRHVRQSNILFLRKIALFLSIVLINSCQHPTGCLGLSDMKKYRDNPDGLTLLKNLNGLAIDGYSAHPARRSGKRRSGQKEQLKMADGGAIEKISLATAVASSIKHQKKPLKEKRAKRRTRDTDGS